MYIQKDKERMQYGYDITVEMCSIQNDTKAAICYKGPLVSKKHDSVANSLLLRQQIKNKTIDLYKGTLKLAVGTQNVQPCFERDLILLGKSNSVWKACLVCSCSYFALVSGNGVCLNIKQCI